MPNNRGRNQFTGNTKLDWLKSAGHSESDECVLWPFTEKVGEYGRLDFEGAKELAHRVAYKLHYGVWPEPCGRHTCDNPLCVNWRHIVPGTQADNVIDRDSRGRTGPRVRRFGEANPQTELTEDDVREIRRLSASGTTGKDLAEIYGISRGAISNILSRKRWPHV